MTATALRPADASFADGEGLLALDRPLEERFFQQMALIRAVEQSLLRLFSEGALSGTTHTSIGQEANAVGILNAIDRGCDTVWSNHRCHGHFIAYCGEVTRLIAEIMGRTTGVCGGRGGSQHLCFRNFHSNGIQGGFTPIAVGCALARKAQGAIALAFLGDGTMGEGMVYEALNLAAVFGAPVLFVVEDNGIAQTTPSSLTLAGSITARAEAFGIAAHGYRGSDPLAIHALASDVIARVRTEGRPALLHLRTQRIGPHSKGDDTRPETELAAARKGDPLPLLRGHVPNAVAIEHFVDGVVAQAIAAASAAPVAGL